MSSASVTENLAPRFLTLESGDPHLVSLLQGDLPKDMGTDASDLRPILIQSNPDWTFEFVRKDLLRGPGAFWIWILALRPDSLVLSVGPILGALGWLGAQAQASGQSLDWARALLTITGILALHAAVNLFNDYHDHVRGWDRVRERGGTRVISRGWLRARDVHRAAWASLAIAVLAGVPVVVSNLSSGVLLVLFAGVAVLEFAISHFGLKYKGFAEVAAWMMFGPLLTGGFAWSMTGEITWQSLALGMVYGSIALLCFHLKNFERILTDGRAGLRTWPVRAGFDSSKTFTYFVLALISFSMAVLAVLVDPVPERIIPLVVLGFAMGPLATRVRRLESPLASRMRGLHAAGLGLAWFNLLAFLLGDIVRLFDGFLGHIL